MKFKSGDQVLITGGKDKGKKSSIVRVLPKSNRVIVKDINMYVKHVKAIMDRPGEKKRLERPMPLSKIAIINDKGEADRIAYKVGKDGQKERVFAKTGALVKEATVEKSSKKTVKKSEKKK